jgi:hypothetical protein
MSYHGGHEILLVHMDMWTAHAFFRPHGPFYYKYAHPHDILLF